MLLTKVETSWLEDSIYVPDGIMHISDGGQSIHEGDDNVDIKAETTDGKTHFILWLEYFLFVFCCFFFFQNQEVNKQTQIVFIFLLVVVRLLN